MPFARTREISLDAFSDKESLRRTLSRQLSPASWLKPHPCLIFHLNVALTALSDDDGRPVPHSANLSSLSARARARVYVRPPMVKNYVSSRSVSHNDVGPLARVNVFEAEA